MNIVTLEIRSWAGISIGAQHSYGSLSFDDKNDELQKVRLTRKLNKQTAKILNDQRNEHEYGFRSGETTECFNDDNHVRKTAKRIWKKICPDGDLLIEGSYAVGDPQRCLDGDPEVVETINDMWKRSEECGGYEGDEETMDSIFREYQAYLKTL